VCQTSINVVHIINDLKSWIMLSITGSSRVKPLKTLILFWQMLFFGAVRLLSIRLEWCLKNTSPLILNQNPLTHPLQRKGVHKGEL